MLHTSLRAPLFRRAPALWVAALLALCALFLSPTAGSAAPGDPPHLLFIGPHGGACEKFKEAAPAAGVRVSCPDDEEIAQDKVDFKVDAVFLQHLRGDYTEKLQERLTVAHQQGTHLLALSTRGGYGLNRLEAEGAVIRDPVIDRSYYSGSVEHFTYLMRYVKAKYVGSGAMPEALEERPIRGFYHPEAPARFDTLDAWQAWARSKGLADPKKPLLVVAVHSLHLTLQQPAVVDALIKEVELQGGRAVAIVDGTPEYEVQIKAAAPDAVLHPCHSFENVPFRIELDAPHLHGAFFRKQSIAEWEHSDWGLAPNEIAFHITGQELLGAIEPQALSGTLAGDGSNEAFTPIPDRVTHLVARALAWARLRHLANAEKRIAIVYYDRDQGKAELMRGSATGMMLNGPRSLLRVLARMAEDGYTIKDRPRDEPSLLAPMLDHGRRIGAWQKVELDRLARSGHAALVPLSQYRRWYEERVSETRRAEVEARWGAPPGDLFVWQGEGAREPMIVIPKVQLGNVLLLPQPLRGEADDPQLLHDDKVPPPHSYLATYFWLQAEWQAHAVVHFGTHGSEFSLPGRATALSRHDWSDIVMGQLPNLNPWVINNLGESLPAKRRAYAVLIDHLVPPSARAGLSDELQNVHSDIERWRSLDAGALKTRFQAQVSAEIRRLRLDEEVASLNTPGEPDQLAETVRGAGREGAKSGAGSGQAGAGAAQVGAGAAQVGGETVEGAPEVELVPEATIEAIDRYLHTLAEEQVHTELHELGVAPAAEKLIPYLAISLGARFSRALAPLLPREAASAQAEQEHFDEMRAHAAVERLVGLIYHQKLSPTQALQAIGARVPKALPEKLTEGFAQLDQLIAGFAQTDQEIEMLMRGLAGRFIPPGPGNSPARNPAVVPTGRNLYVVNPEEIPAKASWDVAAGLVDELLKAEQAKTGQWPTRIGIQMHAFSSLQDYGITEAQVLRLIGVEPIWNVANQVRGFRVIPREALGRPRVDVFLSAGGYYRDLLPSRMTLLDQAIRAAAASPEADNPLAKANREVEAQLLAEGMAPEQAAIQAKARIFGSPPGEMSDRTLYYMLERSGDWDSVDELLERYIRHESHVYTEGAWGVSAQSAYKGHIAGTSIVLRAWSDGTRSPLNNKYMWLHGGVFTKVVGHLTGTQPRYLLTDVRDADKARFVSSEDAVRADTRVRLFNKKFIEGMMKEGYAGADQLAVHVSNVLGWQIFRPEAVDDGIWNEIVETYVRDRHQLGLRAFFAAENPHAFQALTATMLEAARKGYWRADPETLAEVARAYAESVVAHGPNGALQDGPNTKLTAIVAETLQAAAAPGDAELAEQVVQKMAELRAQMAAQAADRAEAVAQAAQRAQTAPGEAAAQSAQQSAERGPVEDVEGIVLSPSETATDWWPWLLGAGFLLILGLGVLRGHQRGRRS